MLEATLHDLNLKGMKIIVKQNATKIFFRNLLVKMSSNESALSAVLSKVTFNVYRDGVCPSIRFLDPPPSYQFCTFNFYYFRVRLG